MSNPEQFTPRSGMSDADEKLLTTFMEAQNKLEGRLFSENVLAGIKAVLRMQSETKANVCVPLDVARLIRKVCLPHNPNKCRGWHPDNLAAVRTFIAAVEAANAKSV